MLRCKDIAVRQEGPYDDVKISDNAFDVLHKGCVMAKELHCRDVGPDCDAVVTAESEDEILLQVAEHAKTVHGMSEEEVSDQAFQAHVRGQIHDQAEAM